MKVSFVCTTYRRFYCVRRIIAMYQAQTYQDKELIIFNTDTEHPFTLGIDDDSIIVVNNAKSTTQAKIIRIGEKYSPMQ